MKEPATVGPLTPDIFSTDNIAWVWDHGGGDSNPFLGDPTTQRGWMRVMASLARMYGYEVAPR